jgi:glucose-1-phosphate thymidylyltransferase
MNIIIPMAGMGKRLRPHTLTVPKPLVSLAGKPIVQHLVEDIAALVHEPLDTIVFVTGYFGKAVEAHLISVAESLGAKGRIAYQDEPLGTAHAVNCGREALKGKVIVAFADTLFTADFKLDPSKDGVLWVKKIENPAAFGVVQLNPEGDIVDFVEKPKHFVSDLAMIGIYYFREGEKLAAEIDYLLENKVTKGGEYQLPDALKRLTDKGAKLAPGTVDTWMDCGNAAVTVETNSKVLELKHPYSHLAADVRLVNSVVIDPCYIGAGSLIENAVLGPHVSIGTNCVIKDARIEKAIVQNDTHLSGVCARDSMVGSHVRIVNKALRLSVGDYNTIE